MLKIRIGDMRGVLNCPAVNFDFTWKPEWFTDPMAIRIVEDMDNSKVVSPDEIIHPVFGRITPYDLSDYTKAVLVALFTKKEFMNYSHFDKDGVQWLAEISRKRDVYLATNDYCLSIRGPFEALVLNDDTIVHNWNELSGKIYQWKLNTEITDDNDFFN